MKYIDADKLIERLEEMKRAEYENCGGVNSKTGALQEVQELITSLQQDKDVLDLCSQVWWEDRGWMMIPPNITLKGLESLLERVRHKIKWNEENGIEEREQPEVDLDFQVFAKEMDAVFNLPKEVTENTEENPLNWEYAIARHFAEWGAIHLNARKK